MKVYGRASASEFLGDCIVYRKLLPYDNRLPNLDEINRQIGLPAGQIPRKQDPGYARVIVQLLKRAHEIETSEKAIRHLVHLGDTRLADGTAFSNLCQAGNWPGMVFIGSENNKPATFEKVALGTDQTMVLANRWSALQDFDRACTASGLHVDQSTAVVIDLDKTTVGARGRNASVIDQARVEAVQVTVSDLLGAAFDPDAFQKVYDQLNQPEFHPFTADNQDYLAYICLIIGSGLYQAERVISEVQAGTLQSFEQFIAQVNARRSALPAGLAAIHQDIYANVQQGDPTPFKRFRYNEYKTTIGRFGSLDDAQPAEVLLANEIVITYEVMALAMEWKKRGALIFGLSDKPDEASVPTAELAAQGYQPIHRTVTHVVGATHEV